MTQDLNNNNTNTNANAKLYQFKKIKCQDTKDYQFLLEQFKYSIQSLDNDIKTFSILLFNYIYSYNDELLYITSNDILASKFSNYIYLRNDVFSRHLVDILSTINLILRNHITLKILPLTNECTTISIHPSF